MINLTSWTRKFAPLHTLTPDQNAQNVPTGRLLEPAAEGARFPHLHATSRMPGSTAESHQQRRETYFRGRSIKYTFLCSHNPWPGVLR